MYKLYTHLLGILAFTFVSVPLRAQISCTGKHSPFKKIVGGGVSIGLGFQSWSQKYGGLFTLPNGDRFRIEATNSDKRVAGVRGKQNTSRFEIRYDKYSHYYEGGEGGMAGPRFKSSTQRPVLVLKETRSNRYKKTKTYELKAGRIFSFDETVLHPEKIQSYTFQVILDYEKRGNRWKATDGVLYIYEKSEANPRRKRVATIQGEGVLKSIQNQFNLKDR